ncbi:hypothetical protein AXF42_Ash020995 [Apostasia shenzhenica]|uniref:Uncharacterized protein n=1 Tax=Apostasia shenzhenica TaxID=1088818 RepID=A0A2I0AEZ7_9ASPA|nr:hypothetical protein AXF42_Ash020995 [Apostasia shenzhenica]
MGLRDRNRIQAYRVIGSAEAVLCTFHSEKKHERSFKRERKIPFGIKSHSTGLGQLQSPYLVGSAVPQAHRFP